MRANVLAAALLFLGIVGETVNVSAESSYEELLCGDWYVSGHGIEITIEPFDDNYVLMKANTLVSAHEELVEEDTQEYGRVYYLAENSADPRQWDSYDGRLYIQQFDENCIWIHLDASSDREGEQYFYGGSTGMGNLFSAVPYDREHSQEADPDEYSFMGTWNSTVSDKQLTITPIPDSSDVYQRVDHLIEITEGGIVTETRVLGGQPDGQKLTMGTNPYNSVYYQLKTFHTLEEYDENDMVIETFEKEGHVSPSGKYGFLSRKGENDEDY